MAETLRDWSHFFPLEMEANNNQSSLTAIQTNPGMIESLMNEYLPSGYQHHLK